MQRVDRMLNMLVEHEPPDGQVAGAGEITEGDRLRDHLRIEHRTPADFEPVVILRVNPEDRHHGHAVLVRHLPCQLHRRRGLQQREERSAKQPRLLAGDDDDRLRIGQAFRRGARRGRRPAPLLLCQQHTGEIGGPPRMRLPARDGLGPRPGRRRVAREERAHLVVLECVVGRKAPDPGEPANVDCQG